MLKPWKTLTSTVAATNPWWTYKRDTFRTAGGYEGEYHYVHTEGASMIVPVTGDGKIILVNQYRYLRNRESIEFPCGGVKAGKSYDETALLELEEETGYQSGDIRRVGEFNPYNGVTDEICAVFVARDLRRTIAKPDATEEFEIVMCSAGELDAMIRSAKVWDGMTLAGWMLVRDQLRRS